MKPETYISFWEVNNAHSECVVQFLSRDQAVAFMQSYGESEWYVMRRTLYFADDLDPRQIYEDVLVESEGEWIDYHERYEDLLLGLSSAEYKALHLNSWLADTEE